jgi:signal peptidase II
MDMGDQDRTVQTNAGTGLVDRYRAELPDRMGHLIFWPILFAGLVADLWSKWAVFSWLEHRMGQSAEIVEGFLSFRLALNTGAAFGIFSGKLPFLVGVSVLALLAILGLFFFGSGRQRLIQLSLGLFGAGVSGNLWDRLFNHGQVRDFIDVYWRARHWHTFNVADALLCVAVGLLVIATLSTGSSDRTRAPQQK